MASHLKKYKDNLPHDIIKSVILRYLPWQIGLPKVDKNSWKRLLNGRWILTDCRLFKSGFLKGTLRKLSQTTKQFSLDRLIYLH